MPAMYPLLAGVRKDASSVELMVNGKRYLGVKKVSYRQKRSPGTVYGLSAQPIGITRGTYELVEGSLSILREEFDDLATDLAALNAVPGGAILESNTMLSISYTEGPLAGVPLVSPGSSDKIYGVSFTGTDHNIEAGSSDPILVDMSFVGRYMTVVNDYAAMMNLLKGVTAAVAA